MIRWKGGMYLYGFKLITYCVQLSTRWSVRCLGNVLKMDTVPLNPISHNINQRSLSCVCGTGPTQVAVARWAGAIFKSTLQAPCGQRIFIDMG